MRQMLSGLYIHYLGVTVNEPSSLRETVIDYNLSTDPYSSVRSEFTLERGFRNSARRKDQGRKKKELNLR